MANVVEILIKARDDASKALDRVGGRLDNLADRARRARGPLLAVAAATAGIGIAGVKMAADFETALAEVRTLLPNLDQGGLEQLRKGILDFSKELGIATNQSVPALYQAISAGVPADNVLDFMRTAAKASIGGVTELETAVDGITSVVNAYGASVLNAGEASDLMFTAVRLGKTTFDELSRSLFNVIPTAASLDISFAEVAAAMATMTAQGVPTRVATTNLRQAFVEASKTGSNLDKAIRELAGTGLAQLTKEGNTAFSVFNDLRESMPAQEFRDLFGSVEALNAVLLITGPQAAGMQSALDDMGDSTGAADAAFKGIADTAGFKFKQAMVSLQVEMIGIGDVIMPVALRVVKVIGDLVQRFADLSSPVKTAIVVVGGIVGALAALLLILPTLISGIAAVGVAFTFLAANPIGLVLVGLAAIVLAAEGLARILRAFGVDIVTPFELLGDSMSHLGSTIFQTKSEVGALADEFNRATEEATAFTSALQEQTVVQLEQTPADLQAQRFELIKDRKKLQDEFARLAAAVSEQGSLILARDVKRVAEAMREMEEAIGEAVAGQKDFEDKIITVRDRLAGLSKGVTDTGTSVEKVIPIFREFAAVLEEVATAGGLTDKALQTIADEAFVISRLRASGQFDRGVDDFGDLGFTRAQAIRLTVLKGLREFQTELRRLAGERFGGASILEAYRQDLITLEEAFNALTGAAIVAGKALDPAPLDRYASGLRGMARAADTAKAAFLGLNAAQFLSAGALALPAPVSDFALARGALGIRGPVTDPSTGQPFDVEAARREFERRRAESTVINLGGITINGNVDDPDEFARKVAREVDRELGHAAARDEALRSF